LAKARLHKMDRRAAPVIRAAAHFDLRFGNQRPHRFAVAHQLSTATRGEIDLR
jgi:hypothetical protein